MDLKSENCFLNPFSAFVLRFPKTNHPSSSHGLFWASEQFYSKCVERREGSRETVTSK